MDYFKPQGMIIWRKLELTSTNEVKTGKGTYKKINVYYNAN